MIKILVHCYGLNGKAGEAIELYHKMPKDFIDEITNISVLNACSHCGFIDEATALFQNIQDKTESIYSAMVYVNLFSF